MVKAREKIRTMVIYRIFSLIVVSTVISVYCNHSSAAFYNFKVKGNFYSLELDSKRLWFETPFLTYVVKRKKCNSQRYMRFVSHFNSKVRGQNKPKEIPGRYKKYYLSPKRPSIQIPSSEKVFLFEGFEQSHVPIAGELGLYLLNLPAMVYQLDVLSEAECS